MIDTPNALEANEHRGWAIVANGFVFVSGLLPIVPGSANRPTQSTEAQMNQLMSNLAAVLQAAESHLNRLVSVTVFVADIDLCPVVDRVYRDRMSQQCPVRAVVVASPPWPAGASVALQAVALVGTPVARARAALARWFARHSWPVSPAREIGSRRLVRATGDRTRKP
jgi:enamine deaminase RidA (YjgF/YER057c/UK114 family)